MSRTVNFKTRNPLVPVSHTRSGAGKHGASEKAKRTNEKSQFRKNLNRDWF